MTLALTIGKWGGFYVFCDYTLRICLGWVALTFIPRDLDEILGDYQCMLHSLAKDWEDK